MEQILVPLEFLLSLEFLVVIGDFFIARCADIGGEWDAAANACITEWGK